MKEITVDLGKRSYPVFIGEALLNKKGILIDYIQGEKVCIVTNDTVAALYLERLKDQLSDYELSWLIIEDGEQFKNSQTFLQILDFLLSNQVDRKSTVVALGGGVVGDVTGYAAASCMRGLNFIQIPTTLLSQVDSSVGGKTGINHPAGKNLIGAFYQPACVLADLNTLDSLSEREFSAGMAEVIKYGLIYDFEFFEWIESNIEQIKARNKEHLAHIVARSCEIKAQVVSKDETEQGLRAILNLGHTFGHAIEAATGYSSWLHGEAISAGMVIAAKLSCALSNIDVQSVERISELFIQFNLPVDPPENMTTQQMKDLMLYDKKTLNSVVRLILLKSLGDAYVTSEYSEEILDHVLNSALEL